MTAAADFDAKAFERAFVFRGALGALHSKTKTVFRVWVPTAGAVTLNLFSHGLGRDADERIAMERGPRGTWEVSLRGDLHGVFYTFSATINGIENAGAVDPYAFAVGANGLRGMVVDLSRTNPRAWLRRRKTCRHGAFMKAAGIKSFARNRPFIFGYR